MLVKLIKGIYVLLIKVKQYCENLSHNTTIWSTEFLLARFSVPMAEIYTDPKSVGVLVTNKWSVWNNPRSENPHTYVYTLKYDFVLPDKCGTCYPQTLGIRISFVLSTVATLLPFYNLLCHKEITATTTCYYWS